MTDFIDDLTAIPGPKSDLTSIGSGDPDKYIQATDYNTIRQAMYDLRTHVIDLEAGGYIDVKAYGALGNWNPVTQTGADDRAAFVAAFAAAKALGSTSVLIPPGNYRFSKVVQLVGFVGLKIRASAFVSIFYASDDLTLIPDASHAYSYGHVRSAFQITGGRDIEFCDLEFVGGDAQEVSNRNVGVGVHASRVTGTRMTNCRARGGAGLFTQDAYTNSGYTHDNAITVSSGIVTLTNGSDPNGEFHAGMVGRHVTIAYAVNPVNDGVFQVLEVLSATQLKYANASAIAEAAPGSTLIWAVNDGDDDTKLIGCRWENCRGISCTGNGGSYIGCTFTQPLTFDQSGIPDSFTDSGASTIISDATGSFGPTVVGRYVKILGATSAANNGLFLITAATAKSATTPATLTYANASGVTELAPYATANWWIAGGERSGIGAGGGAISSASGVVTFTAATALFRASDVGKSLVITDATSAANNGNKVITRYISSTSVQYVQSGAVSEAYAKVFTVDGYDSSRGDSTIGPAISSTSTGVGAGTFTDTSLTMVTNAYAGRYLTDLAGRQWHILSNTGTVFTLTDAATPTAGGYTVSAGSTHGSTHAIYYFAGRSRIVVGDCVFRGVRTVGVKISGSSLPIHEVEVRGCVFDECGSGIIAGADDSQIHENLSFHHNRLVNCGIGRAGWTDQIGINVLGSRNVSVTDNQFHITRGATAALVNTLSVGGLYAIGVGRYLAGVSQPMDDVLIARNKFTNDPLSCRAEQVGAAAVYTDRVGQRSKYRTGGTLTKSGNVMTLNDPSAVFSQSDVGSSIQVCFAPDAGNNSSSALEVKVGEWTVLSVTSTSTLTYENAAGVGGAVSAGTYRVKPKALRGGSCVVSDNTVIAYGSIGIQTVSCVAPQVNGNVFSRMATCISEAGSVAPHIANNVELHTGSNNARIVITSATSWPNIYDNFVTNGALAGGNLTSEASATKSDMGIGIDGSTSIDHPLLSKRGRAVPTARRGENVFSFGSELVDGDTFAYNGTIYTYKATSPTGNQFNSLAGLIALLDARAGEACVDYGADFAVTVVTGHIKIKGAVGDVVDAYYIDTINMCNPTALVIPRNDTGGGEAIQYSRGEGSGGLGNKYVIWSMQTSLAGGAWVAADTDAAMTLLASGWRTVKSSKNAGCCEVIKHAGTEAGGEEVRWKL